MLESVREIRGHVNKQLTNHSSATERGIELGFYIATLLLYSSTHDVRQATLLSKKVAQLCCLSGMGLSK